MPPTTFGIALAEYFGIARIFALGAERQEKVAPGFEPARLQNRQHDVARRAGISRAFQDDQLARSQLPRQSPAVELTTNRRSGSRARRSAASARR